MRFNSFFYLVIFFSFNLCFSQVAPDLRVIDNKGTLKNINKVNYGTTAITNSNKTTFNPNTNNSEINLKGDVYFQKNNNNDIVGKYLFDGNKWVNLDTGPRIIAAGRIEVNEAKRVPWSTRWKYNFVANNTYNSTVKHYHYNNSNEGSSGYDGYFYVEIPENTSTKNFAIQLTPEFDGNDPYLVPTYKITKKSGGKLTELLIKMHRKGAFTSFPHPSAISYTVIGWD